MLQVIQYQKTGEMRVEELPDPTLDKGSLLVRTGSSLISAGTERTSVETARASMVGKARSRPDLVRQVLENVKSEGLVATYKKVKNRLDNYKELGYSSAGIVIASDVDGFVPGDRVACGGPAYHAELVSIPKHLAAKLPADVTFEEGSFATIGAIALQGVRQAQVQIGETVAVIGLGLLGLLTVQLLRANGCRVIGLDVTDAHWALARQLGCMDCLWSNVEAVRHIEAMTQGYGTDAVIITASTQSNEPLELSLKMARKKSRTVVVGAVGMNVPRSPFYEKELDLRISCSYGPGRYDPAYEDRGEDYPIGYVRWTENRNMASVIDLIARRCIDVRPLITHRFAIADALKAYDLITRKGEKYLGVLITYPDAVDATKPRVRRVSVAAASPADTRTSVGFIGAGNFAQSYLLPPMKKLPVLLKSVVTGTPVNAKSVADKFGFQECGTEAAIVVEDPAVDAAVIATRHDTHAQFVYEALTKGKHVFVEKPLAVTREELARIVSLREQSPQAAGKHVMVGFNRRFSKPFKDIAEFFENRREPLVVSYRVNAGSLPATHWILSAGQGGRMIGEGCHFIDCMQFLIGARPVHVVARALSLGGGVRSSPESIVATVTFADGSVGTLTYLANGDAAMGKEYCEVFGAGKSAVMDNFKEVRFFARGKQSKKSYDGSKGHVEEVRHFVRLIRGETAPLLTFEQCVDATLVTFAVMESLKEGAGVTLA
ncbi:MAG: bi-domain-containing oxidoreductase [Bacteroidetes bacterium]|nr:bi-domain-containing oxidoreductase [Bacteroidota bacterium]